MYAYGIEWQKMIDVIIWRSGAEEMNYAVTALRSPNMTKMSCCETEATAADT